MSQAETPKSRKKDAVGKTGKIDRHRIRVLIDFKCHHLYIEYLGTGRESLKETKKKWILHISLNDQHAFAKPRPPK